MLAVRFVVSVLLFLFPAICQAQGSFSGRAVQAMGQGPTQSKNIDDLKREVIAVSRDLDAAQKGAVYSKLKPQDETSPGMRYFPADPKKKKPARYTFATIEAKQTAVLQKKQAFTDAMHALERAAEIAKQKR